MESRPVNDRPEVQNTGTLEFGSVATRIGSEGPKLALALDVVGRV